MMTVLAALALWGWGGLHVDVVYGPLPWGVAAYSEMDFTRSCTIYIDPERENERTLLHEIGHCVGAFYYHDNPAQPHSSDPESVMYDFYAPGQRITVEDRLTVFKNTRWFLANRVPIPMLSR